MTPRDRATLIRKLGYLEKNLDLLGEYRAMPQAELFASIEKTSAVERLMQTAIESVIDCSRLLVTLEDWRKLRDEREAWVILAEHTVIAPELAERLTRAKGLRNILVHEYTTLDPAILYESLQEGTRDLRSFAVAMAGWVEQ